MKVEPTENEKTSASFQPKISTLEKTSFSSPSPFDFSLISNSPLRLQLINCGLECDSGVCERVSARKVG